MAASKHSKHKKQSKPSASASADALSGSASASRLADNAQPLDLHLEQEMARLGLLSHQRPTRLLIALSGGMDSVALLHGLYVLSQSYPLTLRAAYVEHGWRQSPVPELNVISQLCQKYNIPWVMTPLARHMEKNEASARQGRYEALQQLAEQFDLEAILTAHHGEDAIETTLLNLFRGSGPEGLRGMQQIIPVDGITGHALDSQIQVVRPLLTLDKEPIREYIEHHKLSYSDDPTNADMNHPRNLLRKEIIPAIESGFPQFKEAMERFHTILAGYQQVMDQAVQPIWESLFQRGALRVQPLCQMERPYQQQIVKRFLEVHHVPVTNQLIEQVIDFVMGRGVGEKDSSNLMSVPTPLFGVTKPDPWFLSIYKHRLRLVQGEPKASDGTLDLMAQSTQAIEPVSFILSTVSRAHLEEPAEEKSGEGERDSGESVSVSEVSEVSEVSDTAKPSDTKNTDGQEDESANKTETFNATRSKKGRSSRSLAPLDQDLKRWAFDVQTVSLPGFQGVLKITPFSKLGDIPPKLPSTRSNKVYVNLKHLLNEPLTVRTRLIGDRIMPMGMRASMRMKNYFINQGIPRFERESVPLLVNKDEVLWVIGVGISEKLRVEKQPTHCLEFIPQILVPASVDSSCQETESELSPSV